MFCDSNPWLFAIIDLNQHAFSVLKGVTPTFSNLGILLKIDIKNCPLLGKLLSVWKTVSVLPKSALSAQSAKIGENSRSFFNVSYTWYKSLPWTKIYLCEMGEVADLQVLSSPKIWLRIDRKRNNFNIVLGIYLETDKSWPYLV